MIVASMPGTAPRFSVCLEAAQYQRRIPGLVVDRRKLKPTAPTLADFDMTPARVIGVDGEQSEVTWSDDAGLSTRWAVVTRFWSKARGAIRLQRLNVVHGASARRPRP